VRRFLLISILVALTASCGAEETCEQGRGIKTSYGRLTTTECTDAKGYTTRQWVSLDQQKLLEGKFLSGDLAIEKTRTYWIFSGQALAETGCPDRLYLIDLSMKPVKVIAFGVKNACNLFHWASWGDKRSVIALKNNVSFVYENGRITSPASGKKLWNAIEPPHAGPGLLEVDAVGFAEDVPLPKP
jgi:hypothetical protein